MNTNTGRVFTSYQRHAQRVSERELVRILQRLEAQRASSHARSVEVMTELRRRPCMAATAAPGTPGALSREDLLEAEMSSALVKTPYQARQDVVTAVALDERMFATMNLLRAGRIQWAQVQVIARHTVPLADHVFTRAVADGLSPREAGQTARDTVAQLEAMVLPRAATLTRRKLERRVEKAAATLAPDYVEERRRQAVKGRSVAPPSSTSDDPDGRHMGDVFAHLPATEAQAVWNTVDAYARAMRAAGDERTLEELRADTLTHLILRGHPPTDLHVAGRSATPAAPEAAERHAADPTRPLPTTNNPADTPDNAAPNAAAPNNAAPNDAAPNADAPDHAAPDHAAPDHAAPDHAAPDHAAPDHAAPDHAAPDHAAPDVAAPDNAAPDNATPSNPAPADPAPGACACGGVPAARRDVETRPAPAPMDWARTAGFDAYGLRANVEVVVSLETLLGTSDAPGELKGHGPVTAQVARDIAFKAGGTWRRLVIDPLGRLVDHGRTRYVPAEPLKQYIRGRDRSCRTPWCDRPAGACDIDHVAPFPTGPTAAHNLQCKCRRCHRLKHEGRWAHQVLADGTIRMTSPTGMTYDSEPADLRPIPVPRPRRQRLPAPVSDRGRPPF